MVHRRGLGRGRGKGYYNLVPRDPYVHGLSAKGIKQYEKAPYSPSGNFYFEKGTGGKLVEKKGKKYVEVDYDPYFHPPTKLDATYIFTARDDTGKKKKFKTWDDFQPKVSETFVTEGKRYRVETKPTKKRFPVAPYPIVDEINFKVKDVESLQKLGEVDKEIFDIIDEDYASCVTGSSARDYLDIPETKSELDDLIKKIEKKKGLLK